jgi:hypothetical protein
VEHAAAGVLLTMLGSVVGYTDMIAGLLSQIVLIGGLLSHTGAACGMLVGACWLFEGVGSG